MLVLFILICFGACGIEAQTRRIPPDEMAALSEIAEQLGKKDWDLSLNYCDENFNWYKPIVPTPIYNSTVNCNCSSSDECHISAIILKGQDLSGVLPRSIVKLPYLKIIDLSRNYLSGPLPPEWASTKLEYMKLLLGSRLNLKGKCLVATKSSRYWYSLHINCGGGETKVGNTLYIADESQGGAATLQAAENWGFSSTGHFWDVNATAGYYITKNVSVLTMNDSQLYTSARLSPLSLTYYGRCLANGNYTVTLHFAEIVFRDNRSYQSLGRRIFNVYIQDELVWKDFDIATVAQGVDKAVLLKFNNIVVKNKTIEIRFYWAGKGTTAVPTSGIYGPLISVISVESNFKPPPDQKKKIFMVVGALAFAICLECQLKLDWPTRLSICIGIARGLAFRMRNQDLKIVHRDIKATNDYLMEILTLRSRLWFG
ncbi:putative LRR receptor-like serine/threonine-protein kinase [Camellia lanceoleosa]|uniref:LRR receptor-like serine/threonine-protein kinase n=1 Tax=Camellia lanceoleosa TaxID=1840588 RepID=A0ACC0GKF7_9ERIC|nr:putative LRR receptor-like serine/threonine-protein kinase [Camellia lanceoleosa]